MLYRFIIVDDEYYVRQSVIHCIDWEAEGFVFAGEMESAAQTMEFLESNAVDLIVTDVAMPNESGLSLISQVGQKYPSIRFIVLSGYSNFEFTKEAFLRGAANYLLKPVDHSELRVTLAKIKEALDGENARLLLQLRGDNEASQQMFEKNRYSLYSLLDGIPSEEANQLLFSAGLYPEKSGIVCVFDIASVDMTNSGYWERHSKRFQLRRMAEEYFSHAMKLIISADTFDRSVLLLKTSASESVMDKVLHDFGIFFRQSTGMSIVVGFSSKVLCTTEGISEGYRHALELFRLRILYGTDFNALRSTFSTHEEIEKIVSRCEEIKNAMNAGDEAAVRQLLDEIFQQMKEKYLSIGAIELVINSLLFLVINYSVTHRLQYFNVKNNWAAHSGSDLLNSGLPMSHIQEKFEQLFLAILAQLHTPKSVTFIERLVKEAQIMIANNYPTENLGLNSIASALLISPSYLSRSFKRQVGKNITQYIAETRIDQAKKLLCTTDKRVGEIASEVGYNDAYYFSKQFKKITRCSPSEFRGKARLL